MIPFRIRIWGISAFLLAAIGCREPDSALTRAVGTGIRVFSAREYGNVRIEWDTVPGAVSYGITVKGPVTVPEMTGFSSRRFHILGLTRGTYTTFVTAFDLQGRTVGTTDKVKYTLLFDNTREPQKSFSSGSDALTLEPSGTWSTRLSEFELIVDDELPLGAYGYQFKIGGGSTADSKQTSVLSGPGRENIILNKEIRDTPVRVYPALQVLYRGQKKSYELPSGGTVFYAKGAPAQAPGAISGLKGSLNASNNVGLEWSNDPDVWLYVIGYETPAGIKKQVSISAYDQQGVLRASPLQKIIPALEAGQYTFSLYAFNNKGRGGVKSLTLTVP